MKLSRLYSNKPRVFGAIQFNDGLNVVLAEIRIPENRKKDTHNLGKSTLGRLLDFAFLSTRRQTFFLIKYPELFASFVFFLEVELEDGSFVTVRRSVEEATKVAFKKHAESRVDLAEAAQEAWDHWDVPFERAKTILDGYVNWLAIKPWDYRKGIGYLLRSQDDYRDVFQLGKFVGAHSDWKPFLAKMLGFDGQLVARHYEKEDDLATKQTTATTLRAEIGSGLEDVSKIDGMLLLKRQEAQQKQLQADAFDFRSQDKVDTKALVENVDVRIAALNTRKYGLSQSKKKISVSLAEGDILFDPEEASRLFGEAGVLFEGQIKRDFEQLIEFNKAITGERRDYLNQELAEIDAELKAIGTELNTLGKRRSQLLANLGTTDAFARYKQLSSELVVLRADIESLERQRGGIERLQGLRAEIRALTEETGRLQVEVEKDVEAQSSDAGSRFSTIRLYFNEIVQEVIDRKALLSVSQNREGHLEFKAEILDEAGNATSADDGHTYRKLLCIAFDLAVLRAHTGDRYPRFVYHDGVFESLDDRKKENLVGVLRRYVEIGIQPIITLIDSDMPKDGAPLFDTTDVIVTLHDQGDEGRLFKMKSW